MKPKKPAPELDKVLHFTVAGGEVRLGGPLSASAAAAVASARARADASIAHWAFVRHREQQAQRRASSAAAAAASARKRAKASAKHWTNQWFALAHQEHPKFGRQRLAQAARVLAANGGTNANAERAIKSATKRDQISVDRAQQFLDRLRNPRQS